MPGAVDEIGFGSLQKLEGRGVVAAFSTSTLEQTVLQAVGSSTASCYRHKSRGDMHDSSTKQAVEVRSYRQCLRLCRLPYSVKLSLQAGAALQQRAGEAKFQPCSLHLHG